MMRFWVSRLRRFGHRDNDINMRQIVNKTLRANYSVFMQSEDFIKDVQNLYT